MKSKKQLIEQIQQLSLSGKSDLEQLEELVNLAKQYNLALSTPEAKATLDLQRKLDQVHEQLTLLRIRNQIEELKGNHHNG